MPHEATHASFFSGVGGLDLGLERAGWRTVSFSEIDPYASAVLAERWPGVPNLGDIVRLDERHRGQSAEGYGGDAGEVSAPRDHAAWQYATLWSGGFPCQDLSVAGKRAGFGLADGVRQLSGVDSSGPDGGVPVGRRLVHRQDGDDGDRYATVTRSGLAFAFLDLVERHRPPAILLENVPGLLSSHRGRDFGTLLDRLAELGYGWAYRILNARHFGVPQRRRRVFIVALNLERGFGPDSAAAVLSVGSRCGRHPATGHATGEGAADGARIGLDIAGGLTRRYGKGVNTTADDGGVVISPSPDPGGVRAPDGLAGRVDDLAPTLRVGAARPQDGGPGDTVPIITALRASTGGPDDNRAQGGHLIARGRSLNPSAERDAAGLEPDADSLLPLGLDSHRYRCCGNGVVSNVAEWVGVRLREAVA